MKTIQLWLLYLVLILALLVCGAFVVAVYNEMDPAGPYIDGYP